MSTFLELLSYWRPLLDGLLGTLALTTIALAFGLPISIGIALARTSRYALFRLPARLYVSVFINTPSIVQIFWFFYVIPAVFGVEQSPFLSATCALVCNCAAYFSEIVRGGIATVGRDQWLAARAIGMGFWSSMLFVVLPQAFRRMLPALLNRVVEVIKMTAVAGALGYAELLYQGQLISSALFKPVEIYTVVALVFMVLIVFIVRLAEKLKGQGVR